MLKGTATNRGTSDYASRHKELLYKKLGLNGLYVSPVGYGCYRVDRTNAQYSESLSKALLGGINLIDTSSNYADGESESLVGDVLTKLVSQGKIRREECVVISKAGYLQGSNYQLSQARKSEQKQFQDLVLYEEGLEHCIHPEFLEDQLTRSLKRLKLTTIDCYLLHNPEYYLLWAKKQGIGKTEAHEEYLRRIKAAFIFLEHEVEMRRIGCYGISSNTLPKAKGAYEFIALVDIWEIAQSISPKHHLQIIEFPLNLMETAGMTEINQPGEKTLIDIAQAKELGVLTNRSLNAIREGRLIRLNEDVYQGEAAKQAIAFRKKVQALDRSWKNSSKLREVAIKAICSTQGITSVLVGMRHEKYVDDVLQELHKPYEVNDKKNIWKVISEI